MLSDREHNEPLDERRLTRVETQVEDLIKNVEILRDRTHDHATHLTKSIALIDTIQKERDQFVAMITQLGHLTGEFTGHQGECTSARKEDVAHRARHEEWVAAQFDKIRTRQLTLHGTLLLAMLSAMGGMAWYIVTHAGLATS